MVHHPMSRRQNSRNLHSDGSNRIDCAEGFQLFFLRCSKRVLLNHQCPVDNDSALPVGPMACFLHLRAALYSTAIFTSEPQQLLYMKHNMATCHPSCLSVGLDIAVPTRFNRDKFISCHSDASFRSTVCATKAVPVDPGRVECQLCTLSFPLGTI